MSDSLRCDHCGAYAPANGAVGWRRLDVSPAGIETPTMGGPAMPLDFCGWVCLADYACVRAESQRRRRMA